MIRMLYHTLMEHFHKFTSKSKNNRSRSQLNHQELFNSLFNKCKKRKRNQNRIIGKSPNPKVDKNNKKIKTKKEETTRAATLPLLLLQKNREASRVGQSTPNAKSEGKIANKAVIKSLLKIS